MPRKVKELTVQELDSRIKSVIQHLIDNNKKSKPITVGGVQGLILQIKINYGVGEVSISITWVLRYSNGVRTNEKGEIVQRRRYLGLGPYDRKGRAGLSLGGARDKAGENLQKINNGIDPITEKQETRSAMIAAQLKEVTFKKVALDYIDWISEEKKWKKGSKTYNQWKNSLTSYAFPHIGKMRVCDIEQG